MNEFYKYGVKYLYYFSLVDNFPSMLKVGILPRNVLDRARRNHSSFANEIVQNRRDLVNIICSDGKKRNIHDLVPLYYTPLTPTLFCKQNVFSRIFFAVINTEIIHENGFHFAFCNGNAASSGTKFFNSINQLNQIDWSVINSEYWTSFSDGKRKRNAEFLICPFIPNKFIIKYVVNNLSTKQLLEKYLSTVNLPKDVEIDNSFFFSKNTDKLSSSSFILGLTEEVIDDEYNYSF
jgi:hypothetical protein